jgi:hypothetical protein
MQSKFNELLAIICRFQLEHSNAVVSIWTEVAIVPEIDLELDSNEFILNLNYSCKSAN